MNHLSFYYQSGSGNDIYPSLPPSFSETRIPVGLIIGVIVAILVLGFVLVDLACFKINRQVWPLTHFYSVGLL